MREEKITVQTDLDSSRIARLVQVSSKFKSHIDLKVGNKVANSKSIMGVISLSINSGDEITISCDGQDENEALEGIKNFFM